MMKRLLGLCIVLALAMIAPGWASAEAPGCETRAVPLYRQDLDASGTLELRFYADMPSVPWMGLRAYYKTFLDGDMTLDTQGGLIHVTQADGTWADLDPAAGTLTSDNLSLFITPPEFKEADMSSVASTEAGFIDVADDSCDRPPQPMTLDLGRYGIEMRPEADDVFLPLATLSDLFASYELRYAAWNGEKVYCFDIFDFYAAEDPTALDPDYYKPIFDGALRQPDMADFAYRELCFNIDSFYGFPGAGEHEADIARLGLDGALDADDPNTKRLLKSDRLSDYVVGMERLFNSFLDDKGHTAFTESNELLTGGYGQAAAYTATALLNTLPMSDAHAQCQRATLDCFATQARVCGINPADIAESDPFIAYNTVLMLGLPVDVPRRTYVEQGNTAVFSPQNFEVDYEGWDDYYYGDGTVPLESDTLGCLTEALRRARENPDIRNFVLDLSANLGGDTLASDSMLMLLTGKSYTLWHDRLNGQTVRNDYAIDTNFDGVMDERDGAAAQGLNLAVVVAGGTFSAGNQMAARLKECGVPVLGETSGGGSCPIQKCATADGLSYYMSASINLRLMDGSGLEQGVTPDIPLVTLNADGTRNYDALYDIDVLSRAVDAWYAMKGQVPIVNTQCSNEPAA